jgi:hypothetical protein
MANLYNVPLKNAIQKALANTLTSGETGTITFSTSVSADLQASSSIPGILVIDRIDVNGALTPALTEYISFTGVSGSTVTGLVRGLGGTSALGHAIGAVVEFVPDVVWADAINDVFTEQHTATGNHKVLDWATATDSATITFDIETYKKQRVTLGGNRTLALSNVGNGDAFIVLLGQDGTGSRTVTWFSTIKWDNGVTPTLTSTASKMDVFGFIQNGTGASLGFTVGQNL